MTINEILYNIKYLVSGGNPTDDFPYTDNVIKFWIKNERSSIIEKYVEAGKSVEQFCKEYKLKVKKEDNVIEELPNLSTENKVTELSLPSLIVRGRYTGVQEAHYFTNGNIGDTSNCLERELISCLTVKQFELIKGQRYGNREACLTYINNELRCINLPKGLEFIITRLLLSDPTEETILTGDEYYNADSDYPVSASTATLITNTILKDYFNIIVGNTEDKANDNRGKSQQNVSRR